MNMQEFRKALSAGKTQFTIEADLAQSVHKVTIHADEFDLTMTDEDLEIDLQGWLEKAVDCPVIFTVKP